MVIFGSLGFMFALIAYGEVQSLKKRVAALESGGAGPQ